VDVADAPVPKVDEVLRRQAATLPVLAETAEQTRVRVEALTDGSVGPNIWRPSACN